MAKDRPRTREIVLFGGSFDPPTRAHTELSLRAAVSEESRLIFIPCASSPLKQAGPIASGEQRFSMTVLAISASIGHRADAPRAEVSRLEIDRARHGEPSFFVDTLRQFIAEHSSAASVRFVIGTDQALQFHRWREPRRILELAHAIVLTRHGHTKTAVLAEMARNGFWSADELQVWERSFFDHEPVDLSSTLARALLADPQAPRSRLLEVIHEPVLDYIEENGLYGVSGRRA